MKRNMHEPETQCKVLTSYWRLLFNGRKTQCQDIKSQLLLKPYVDRRCLFCSSQRNRMKTRMMRTLRNRWKTRVRRTWHKPPKLPPPSLHTASSPRLPSGFNATRGWVWQPGFCVINNTIYWVLILSHAAKEQYCYQYKTETVLLHVALLNLCISSSSAELVGANQRKGNRPLLSLESPSLGLQMCIKRDIFQALFYFDLSVSIFGRQVTCLACWLPWESVSLGPCWLSAPSTASGGYTARGGTASSTRGGRPDSQTSAPLLITP